MNTKDLVVNASGILKWKVNDGVFVEKDQCLCIIGEEKHENDGDDSVPKRVLSPYRGCLTRGPQKEDGARVSAGDIVGIFSDCKHEGAIFNSMCTICGMLGISPNDSNCNVTRTTVNTSTGQELILGSGEAKQVQNIIEERLRERKKLALVLDIDHTLLNCEHVKHYENCLVDGLLKSNGVHELIVDGVMHYIRLRPELRTFLRTMSEMYQLHINTHGTRSYAEAVRRILDPKGDLFGDRIISRSDVSHGSKIHKDQSLYHKTLSRVFPCDDSMAIALDDKWQVWQYAPNCVQVRPYRYLFDYLRFRRQQAIIWTASTFGVEITNQDIMRGREAARSKGDKSMLKDDCVLVQSLLTFGGVEVTLKDVRSRYGVPLTPPPPIRDFDDQLSIVEMVLRDVHREYYTKGTGDESSNVPVRDVKQILFRLRRRVLRGTVVLFSGVIQLGTPHPERSELWIIAESMGATCKLGSITDDITHVVGDRPTRKLRQACGMPRVYAVHKSWLCESLYRWRRQVERSHPIPNLQPEHTPKRSRDENSMPRDDDSESLQPPMKRHQQNRSDVPESVNATKDAFDEAKIADSEGSSSSSEVDDDDLDAIERELNGDYEAQGTL